MAVVSARLKPAIHCSRLTFPSRLLNLSPQAATAVAASRALVSSAPTLVSASYSSVIIILIRLRSLSLVSKHLWIVYRHGAFIRCTNFAVILAKCSRRWCSFQDIYLFFVCAFSSSGPYCLTNFRASFSASSSSSCERFCWATANVAVDFLCLCSAPTRYQA